ncbi:DUF742 domain-containing protein [Amycolatopsis aidingensis]|uniref:DUF742 domain-containing protein n=1 Tax=Amycolatopsis aidingensis TaxID=2842453 RepID=UPI001C0E0175|nr:DUF742 domain-containing protein [Amycolatopsis aidingensis]
MGVPGDSAPADEPAVGRSGARFPSARPRKRCEVGRTGARFPSAKLLDSLAEPEPEIEPSPPQVAEPEPRPAERLEDGEELPVESEAARLRVRPYVLTHGRTRSAKHLAMETLIATEPRGPWQDEWLSTESRAVGRLCAEPRSVAEVAALLALPLGVARVLLGDLAEAGLVQVHASLSTPDGRPDLDLMRRVLRGLRAL